MTIAERVSRGVFSGKEDESEQNSRGNLDPRGPDTMTITAVTKVTVIFK